LEGSRPGASLYCTLLERALQARGRTDRPAPADAFAEVVRSGSRASADRSPDAHGFSAIEALSAQIDYDVALIRYARCVGMTVGPDDFDPPAQGRRVIARWTAERGMELP